MSGAATAPTPSLYHPDDNPIVYHIKQLNQRVGRLEQLVETLAAEICTIKAQINRDLIEKMNAEEAASRMI